MFKMIIDYWLRNNIRRMLDHLSLIWKNYKISLIEINYL